MASRNRKKLAELRRVLDAAGISGLTLLSLDDVAPFDEAPETGATFEDNAVAKARDAFRATGSGDGGRRFRAGSRRVERHAGCARRRAGRVCTATTRRTPRCCLAQLRDVPDDRRGAAFVSACALVSESGEAVVRGAWPGSIAREPRGDGGFGYDPVFLPEGSSRTAAELTPEEKDAASHRGRALALLVPSCGTWPRGRTSA